MLDNNNMILGWDDVIQNDGTEFVVLEPGDYDFVVTNFERGRYPGSEKIPACNKALISISVRTPNGTAIIKTDLILYRTLEWKISSFFRCIGMKKHGEKMIMDWNNIVGKTGRANITKKNYIGRDGNEYVKNDVEKFYDPVENEDLDVLPWE